MPDTQQRRDELSTSESPMESGLRARKREATRLCLRRAAVQIVLRDGFTAARLDEICEVAHVSTRTFFNYFTSKAEATVGLPSLEPSAEIERQRSSASSRSSLVEAVLRTVTTMLRLTSLDGPGHLAYARVLLLNPELLDWQLTQLAGMHDGIARLVQPLLADDIASRSADAEAVEVIVAACLSGLRSAARDWVKSGGLMTTDEILETAALRTRRAASLLAA